MAKQKLRKTLKKQRIKNKIPPVGLILLLFLGLAGNAVLLQINQPQKVFAAGDSAYIKTQHYEVTMDATTKDITLDNEISGVNNAFILVSMRGEGEIDAQQLDQIYVTAEFLNTTTVRLTRQDATNDCNIVVQVVEANPDAPTQAFTVTHGEISFTNADTDLTDNIADIGSTANAVVIVNSRWNEAGAFRTDILFTGSLDDTTTVRLTRMTCVTAAIARYQVVKFSEDFVVRKGDVTLIFSATPPVVTDTIATVDTSRSVIYITNNSLHTGLGPTSVQAWISGSEEVSFYRGYTNSLTATAKVEYAVIQFPEGVSLQNENDDWNDVDYSDDAALSPAIDKSSTILFHSNSSTGSGSNYPRPIITGYFNTTENIHFQRSYEGTTIKVAWYAVDISALGIPADPSGTSATYNSDIQFTVDWSDNSAIESGYKIERNTDTGGGFGGYTQIGTVGADAESFVDNVANNPANPPQADARYQYRVRAYNSIANSSYSEDAVTHYTTPAAPTIGVPAYVSDAEITVNWTDTSAFEDGFRVWVSEDGGAYSEVTAGVNTVGAGIETYSYVGSTADHSYKFKVQSHTPNDLTNDSGESSTIYTTPVAPTIGVPAYVSDAEITVNWTDTSAFEDGFRVWVSEDGGAFSEVTAGVNTVGAGIETYSYVGSTADHSYKFKVQSHTPNDLTNDSGESSTIYTTPAAPTIGTPVADSSTAITWNWTDNSAFEESFRLDFTVGGGTDVNDIAADSTNYQTTNLDPNVQYAVHIHAYRADRGESAASASSNSIYTLANIPSGLTLTAGSQTQITASWSANSNSLNTEYYIENTTAATNSGWITSLSWGSAGLSCGTPYSFRVKARNGDSVETGFSAETSISTQSCPTGGGMPSAWFSPPASPAEGFNILINNGASETDSRFVTLSLQGGSDTERMAISNFSDFKNAVQETYASNKEWDLCKGLAFCAGGTHTVYAKFYAPWGTVSDIVSDSITYKIVLPIEVVPPTEEPSEPSIIPEILEPFIPEILKPKPPEVEIPEIPIEELVPEETPLSLQNKWQLLPSKPIRGFVLASLPKEITKLTEKFPQLGETFEKVGITKITDVIKLKALTLTMPKLTEVIGLSSTKIEPGKFALPQGIPIRELSLSDKAKIPTEIVFAKTGGKLIDVNIVLTLNEQGEPQQKINTISGKPLQLVMKPEKPVKSVKGYVVFKSKKPQETSLQIPFNYLMASLIFANPIFAKMQENPVRIEEKLVLLEFEYTDPDGDGIYTAEIQAPLIEGEYEIITVMDFEDPEIGKKEIRLITVVDPEGYIYEKNGDKETRIPGAIVSLFWLNPETKQYELWTAGEYQQENPQVTDVRGTYSFLVPEGYYYLKVETPNYLIYDGKPFQVKEGSGVHINIELKTKYWWLKIVDWKTILLIAVLVLLFYNFYRDKIRERLLKNTKNP